MKNILFYLFIAFLLQGCSSVKVVSDKDPTVDFSQLKTFEFYGWADNSDQKLTRFDKERIEQAKTDWREGKFPQIPNDNKEFIPYG